MKKVTKMSDIQQKFNDAYKTGYNLHEDPKAMELGLDEWLRFLKMHQPEEKPFSEWKWKFDRIWQDEWLNLPNEGVHHFLRQLAKIPSGDVCCEKRILQIAYNLGQLVGSKALDGELQEFKDQIDIDKMLILSNWIEV